MWNEKMTSNENIILHQVPRSKACPSLSPFAIKLETFLRAAQIGYTNDFSKPKSVKSKTPWMTIDGEDIADSQFCIEMLLEKMPDKDISAHLSLEEKAVEKGLRSILEDNFYFCISYFRWVEGDLNYLKNKQFGSLPGPAFSHGTTLKIISKNINNQIDGQGIGRHTREEIFSLSDKDLKALSDYLSDKEFMMGEKVCLIDCVLFGFMVILYYGFPDTLDVRALLDDKYVNLKNHMLHMKEKYWPDWDECIHREKKEFM